MTRSRVLVLVQGPLGERLTGPEIRGWEIARAFAERHDVTVVAPVPESHVREGIRVLRRTRRRIVTELRRHDVVVGPVIPPYAFTALAGRGCLRVADLYDPVDLELATLGGRRGARAATLQRAGRRMHLRWSDLVVCANERQIQRIRDDLGALGRPGRDPAVLVAGMGLPEPPPADEGAPLRDRFPAIGRDDPLILWWGSVWRWLDAETAIEAVGRLARRRPDVRFVITAGRPPNRATDSLNTVEEAREAARSSGLLDRHVFFLDDWVPFEQRHRFLGDADLGLTLHAETPEASLAARARYMDYVWAGVPSVLATGDEVADSLGASGASRLVPPRDPEATAVALDSLLGDSGALREARQACLRTAERCRWSAVLEPLIAGVERLEPPTRSPAAVLRATGDALAYYARRLFAPCA